MQREETVSPPVDEPAEDQAGGYESLKLHGLIRNGSALAALVLAYSMDWMNLFSAGRDLSQVHSTGVSISASAGGRQSIVVKPGDMEVFGIPLTMAFACLLVAGILRVVYPHRRRLHPLVPLVIAAPGTVMLGVVLWRTFQDETVEFLTAGFYVALAAYALNTLFDFIEYLDWRRLGRAGRGG